METLSALQKKIEQLIILVKELKSENAKVDKENKQLQKKLQSFESTVLGNEQDIKVLSEEKARTKMVVEDLIESINAFMQTEKQP
jgi:predicted RNase H-like nuclease (RuvC/YqgF family)